MKKLHVLAALISFLLISPSMMAQSSTGTHAPVRIVFQLTSGDTLVHKGLMKQLRNIYKAEPSAQVEVVCHGPGIDMLISQRSLVADQVVGFLADGVVFDVCQNTMTDKNIRPDMLIQGVQIVPAGVIHVAKRQAEGWSYIKAGF